MICSFTQTYSNNRNELFTYHNKDNVDIHFRNKLDKNYYAFHNSPNSYIENICEQTYFKKINNMEIITYNDISYTQSWFHTLHKLKNDGVKYLFFLQDDVFSQVNDNILDELLIFIKNNEFDMLNIEHLNIDIEKPVIYSHDNIKIYDTKSDDFSKKNLWEFDDGPYVANIDFLLNVVYDDAYFTKDDIWIAEPYLNNKIHVNKIQRLSSNFSMFKRFNIVGKNAWWREDELQRLNSFHK